MRGKLGKSPPLGRAGASRRARAALLALCLAILPAAADGPAEPVPAAAEPSSAPPVSLERLLELPQGFELRPAERRGGGGEAEWRRRFLEAHEQTEQSRTTLQRSKAELAELAESSDAWTVAPPLGAAAPSSNEAPVSYALRQRINREEAALKDSERRLLDLEVEANLAEVPEEWRR